MNTMTNTINPDVRNHAALTDLENAVLYRIASEEQLGEGIDGFRPTQANFADEAEMKRVDGALGSLKQKGVIYDAFEGDMDPMWCTAVHSNRIAAEFCKLNELF